VAEIYENVKMDFWHGIDPVRMKESFILIRLLFPSNKKTS